MFDSKQYEELRETLLKRKQNSNSVSLELDQLKLLFNNLPDMDSLHCCIFLYRVLEDVSRCKESNEAKKHKMREILVMYFGEEPFDKPTVGESIYSYALSVKKADDSMISLLKSFACFMNGYKLPSPSELALERINVSLDYRLTYYRWMMRCALPIICPSFMERSDLIKVFSFRSMSNARSLIMRDFREYVLGEYYQSHRRSETGLVRILRDMVHHLFEYLPTEHVNMQILLSSTKHRDMRLMCLGVETHVPKSRCKNFDVVRTSKRINPTIDFEEFPESRIKDKIAQILSDDNSHLYQMDDIEFKLVSFEFLNDKPVSEYPALWNIGELLSVNNYSLTKCEQLCYLLQARDIFVRQLIHMPSEYITRLVLDGRHKTLVLLKQTIKKLIDMKKIVFTLKVHHQ
ncbi:hypothetical protein ACOME3_009103 [Neoechinorhynchus agilis]